MYFSTVPSQKSTLPALATITEQLLWLGGPGLGSPHPAASCQPENAAPPAHNSHPGVQKQARDAQKENPLDMFASGENWAKLRSFLIHAGGSGGGEGWSSKFTCGRMHEANLSSK